MACKSHGVRKLDNVVLKLDKFLALLHCHILIFSPISVIVIVLIPSLNGYLRENMRIIVDHVHGRSSYVVGCIVIVS